MTTDGERFFQITAESFDLEPDELLILRQVANAIDECGRAEEQLREQGWVCPDRFDVPRPHPCVKILCDARNFVVRGIRTLRFHGTRRGPKANLAAMEEVHEDLPEDDDPPG